MVLHTRQGPVDFLTYQGFELELRNIRKVKNQFESCLEAVNEPLHLAFSLERVKFIDSSAIGMLMAFLKDLTRRGCNFYLICGNEQVISTLQAAYVSELIEVFESPGQLVEILKKAGN